MSGDVDYLIRIVVPDIDAYDVVYKRLISAVEFQDVSASFALETIKYNHRPAARLPQAGLSHRGLERVLADDLRDARVISARSIS